MNKKLFCVVFLFTFISNLYGHSLILNLFDNDDDTITIVGEFDTGAPATGALLKIESLVSGNIIYEKRLPQESEITIDIPKEEYKVILDGGPGHTVEKVGIAPKNGFIKKSSNTSTKSKVKKNKSSNFNIPTLYLSIISFILLFLTIVISIVNTNKLMKKLEHS